MLRLFVTLGLSAASVNGASLRKALSTSPQNQCDGCQYYYDNWCAYWPNKYLDDGLCIKEFPTGVPDRQWTCPNTVTDTAALNGYQEDAPLSDNTEVDTTILSNILTGDVDVTFTYDESTYAQKTITLPIDDVTACIVITKRLKVPGHPVKLFHRRLCNGEKSRTDAYETWSTTKPFAMAHAAGRLRDDNTATDCGQSGNLGLDGEVDGIFGATKLADLATIAVSYDTTKGYSSNGVSAFFNGLALRQRSRDLGDSDWLGTVGSDVDAQSFAGDWGALVPEDLRDPVQVSPKNGNGQCTVQPDPTPRASFDNTLSALTQTELLRRIVQHRETKSELRYPGAKWKDMEQILYGAGGGSDSLFPDQVWGGLTADTAIFVQEALDMQEAKANHPSDWRIFSKLGAGYSYSRFVGEILTNAYGCIPGNDGVEFTIFVRSSIPEDVWIEGGDPLVYAATEKILQALQNGDLDA